MAAPLPPPPAAKPATDADSDMVLRAVTNDNGFRVVVARTTRTVREAVAAQDVTGDVALRFAELLTGAVLLRETMAPDFRLQAILTGAEGNGRLVADARPDGAARGLVTEGLDERQFTMERGSLLRVSRALPGGKVHESVVEVPREASISDALMAYMQESEQVVSVTAVGALAGSRAGRAAPDDHDGIAEAGGYIVQLLPEARRDALAAMTDRLAAFPAMGELLLAGVTAASLLDAVLSGVPYTRTGSSTVRFHCGCSQERVEAAMAMLDRPALEDLASEGADVETRCEYCRTAYRVPVAVIRTLLATSGRVH